MTPYRSTFDLKPGPGLLTFGCADRPDCLLSDSGFSFTLLQDGRETRADIRRLTSINAPLGAEERGLGLDNLQTLAWTDEASGLTGDLVLGSPAGKEYLCLSMKLSNTSSQTRVLQGIDLLSAGSLAEQGDSELYFATADRQDDLAFFSNGWQSWSYSAAFGAAEKQPRAMLGFIPNAASTNPLTPVFRELGRFSADLFAVLGSRRTRAGLLCGFLSQKNFFGCIQADLRRKTGLKIRVQGDQTVLRPGACLQTDWLLLAWVDLDDPDPLKPYIDLAAAYNHARVPERFPSGWCSWYHYETNISAEKIQNNLIALAGLQTRLPLELAQIDDGFAPRNGDWFAFRPGFPGGVAPLAEQIKQTGRMPGLWLAPFIAGAGARLLREHPEYMLKTRRGGWVNAGFISNRFATALDLSYPPALEYAGEVIRAAVHEWGYPYLKLDFLYAGALDGNRHDPTRTRAQILRRGLETLRTCAGEETFLLGCGAPLGSSLGVFDGMRIGADTAASWAPKLFGIPRVFRDDPQLPSTRNAIQNTLTRAALHNRWWANDPDCLLLRPDTGLTLDEVRSHASLIALSGGALLISDDLGQLPPERVRLASALLPLIGRRPQVLDWFDRRTPRLLHLDLQGPAGEWSLLGYFNWSDQPEQTSLQRSDFRLAEGPLVVRSFWDGEIGYALDSQPLWQGTLAAHGCVVLAARTQMAGACYLGSDVHISQGLEVKTWQADGTRIRCELDLGRQAEGRADIQLPGKASSIQWQGQEIKVIPLEEKIIRCPVTFNGSGWLDIRLV